MKPKDEFKKLAERRSISIQGNFYATMIYKFAGDKALQQINNEIEIDLKLRYQKKKEWSKNNKDKVAAHSHKYYLNHPEELRESSKKHYLENKELISEIYKQNRIKNKLHPKDLI